MLAERPIVAIGPHPPRGAPRQPASRCHPADTPLVGLVEYEYELFAFVVEAQTAYGFVARLPQALA